MDNEYPAVKAAAIQAAPDFLDRESGLEKACNLIVEAGQEGADVIVFPEGFVPAHPSWYRFYSEASDHSKRFSRKLFKNAVAIPGPATRQLARAAERAEAYVIIGVCEKAPETTGTMYNSQLFLSPDGEYLGKHQKLTPTIGERLVHAPGRPETFGSFETKFGPASGLICAENANPLAIFALAAEHTRIHGMSWPPCFGDTPMPDRILTISKAFAYMTKSYVISSCGVMDKPMIEEMDIDSEQAENVTGPNRTGGSVIVGPDQEIVAGPLADEEGILYGELDLEYLIDCKLIHDYAGHYNRPDVFQMSINTNSSDIYTPGEQSERPALRTDDESCPTRNLSGVDCGDRNDVRDDSTPET